MSDLEVDAEGAQAGVQALGPQVFFGQLETSWQIVREDGERHFIGQPQPSDLDEFRLGHGSGFDGIPNILLLEAANREFQQPGTGNLPGLDDVVIEAAERFGPAEL